MTDETKTVKAVRPKLNVKKGAQVDLVTANRLARADEPKVGTPEEAQKLVQKYTTEANEILGNARAQAAKILAAAEAEAKKILAAAKAKAGGKD